MEGSHVQLGVGWPGKYKEGAAAVHAIEAHHGDVEPQTIGWPAWSRQPTPHLPPAPCTAENVKIIFAGCKKLEELTGSYSRRGKGPTPFRPAGRSALWCGLREVSETA